MRGWLGGAELGEEVDEEVLLGVFDLVREGGGSAVKGLSAGLLPFVRVSADKDVEAEDVGDGIGHDG